jgi:hypothetical protein
LHGLERPPRVVENYSGDYDASVRRRCSFPRVVHDDAESGVRFDDGAYTTVRASQKGKLWDLADSAISASQEACQV